MKDKQSNVAVLGFIGAAAAVAVLLFRSRRAEASMVERSREPRAPSPGEMARALDDVDALGRVITSEADRYSLDERTAIAWAVRNRARKRGGTIVHLVCDPHCGPCCDGRPFSSARAATATNRDLARQVLAAPQSEDPTRGAVAFFEPIVQDLLTAQHRHGYRLDATEVRAKWNREGQRQLATVGRFEFWT